MSAHARPYDPAPALAQARLRLLEDDQRPTVKRLARLLGVDMRTMRRVLAGRYLRCRDADPIVVRLGFHPLELWPDYYDRRTTP